MASAKYSVQLYSVRTVFEQDWLGTLRKLKNMGYSGVESFGHFAHTSIDFKNALAETGLYLAGHHTPWDFVQDDKIDSTINYFKETGCKYSIVPGLPGNCTESLDAWKRTAEKFNAISKRMQNEGIALGYHNHSEEFKKIDGQIPFCVFFDNTDPEVVLQMDNGNALAGGADVMSVMKPYPGRARSVHLKPYSLSKGYAPVIGEDDINWQEFITFCREKGGTEHFIVEYEEEKVHPQIEGVELCIKALREMESSGKI